MPEPRIYTREEVGLDPWQNRAPFDVPANQRRGLVGHHNGPYMRLDWQGWNNTRLVSREIALVRGIQDYHQGLGWSDSAYSWFLGQSGNLYECRGEMWDQFANGSDVVGENDGPDRVWYTVMFMIGWSGDPRNPAEEEPSPAMLESFDWLVGHVRELGAGNQVKPHNDFKVKRCPGNIMSARCDELDGNAVPTEGVPLSAVPHEDWRKLYNAATVGTYNSVVEDVQLFLAGKNYYTGALDGLKGGRTDMAWVAWEVELGSSEPNSVAGRKSWAAMQDAKYRTPASDCTALEMELQVCDSKVAEMQSRLAEIHTLSTPAT